MCVCVHVVYICVNESMSVYSVHSVSLGIVGACMCVVRGVSVCVWCISV